MFAQAPGIHWGTGVAHGNCRRLFRRASPRRHSDQLGVAMGCSAEQASTTTVCNTGSPIDSRRLRKHRASQTKTRFRCRARNRDAPIVRSLLVSRSSNNEIAMVFRLLKPRKSRCCPRSMYTTIFRSVWRRCHFKWRRQTDRNIVVGMLGGTAVCNYRVQHRFPNGFSARAQTPRLLNEDLIFCRCCI